MAVISLKMTSQGFEIFFESGFSEVNHCLKLPCNILSPKIAKHGLKISET